MKKLLLWSLAVIGVALVIGLFIPTETNPPDDTRIIMEFTYETYIAPPCFEESEPEPTNNIGETELEQAKEIHEAHDSCTENELEPEDDLLGLELLKSIGLMDTKWDAW